MNTVNDFTKRLRECVQESPMTQSALARSAGVTKSALSHALAGRTTQVTANTAIALAKALNVSIEWLILGIGERRRKLLSDDAWKIGEIYQELRSDEQVRVMDFFNELLDARNNNGSALDSLLKRAKGDNE